MNKLINEDEFRQWLINEKKYSKRVASDYISRCRKIQKEFNICLLDATDTKNKFIELTSIIKKEIWECDTSNIKSKYSRFGNIKLAMRKYALFIHKYDEKELKYISITGKTGINNEGEKIR